MIAVFFTLLPACVLLTPEDSRDWGEAHDFMGDTAPPVDTDVPDTSPPVEPLIAIQAFTHDFDEDSWVYRSWSEGNADDVILSIHYSQGEVYADETHHLQLLADGLTEEWGLTLLIIPEKERSKSTSFTAPMAPYLTWMIQASTTTESDCLVTGADPSFYAEYGCQD